MNLDNKLKEMQTIAVEKELQAEGRSLKSEHNYMVKTIVSGRSTPNAVSRFNTASQMHICTKCGDSTFCGDNLPKIGCVK